MAQLILGRDPTGLPRDINVSATGDLYTVGTANMLQAGTITMLQAGTVSKLQSGTISMSQAGTVTMLQAGTINTVSVLTMLNAGTITTLQSGTIGMVQAGTISQLQAGTITMLQAGTISSEPSGPGTYGTPTHTAPSAGTALGTILASNANRLYALFINDSDTTVYLNLGGTAAANTGIRLNALGGAYEMSKKAGNLYTGVVTGISSADSKVICVTEGV